LLTFHLADLLSKLENSLHLGYLCLLAEQRNKAVDVLVVVLDDGCVLEELLLLLGSDGLVLQEVGGELTKYVGILAHYDAGLDVLLFVSNRFELVLLHINQRLNKPHAESVYSSIAHSFLI
jgi:hypothetical protein